MKRKQQTLLEEGEKGFRKKAVFRRFSCRDGIPGIRQRKSTQVSKEPKLSVSIFITLNIQRG